jgi:hypothetical protein
MSYNVHCINSILDKKKINEKKQKRGAVKVSALLKNVKIHSHFINLKGKSSAFIYMRFLIEMKKSKSKKKKKHQKNRKRIYYVNIFETG